MKLTEFLHHQLSRRWVVKAPSKVVAVPDEQLSAGWDGLDGIEVNLHAVLTRRKVLLGRWVGWIHVPHPVRAGLVQAVDEVVELLVDVDLGKEIVEELLIILFLMEEFWKEKKLHFSLSFNTLN